MQTIRARHASQSTSSPPSVWVCLPKACATGSRTVRPSPSHFPSQKATQTIAVFRQDQATLQAATRDPAARFAEGATTQDPDPDLAQEAVRTHAALRQLANVEVVAEAALTAPHPALDHDPVPQHPANSRASALTHPPFLDHAPRHPGNAVAAPHFRYPDLVPHRQRANQHVADVAHLALYPVLHLHAVVESTRRPRLARHLHHRVVDAILVVRLPGVDARRAVHHRPKGRGERGMLVIVRRRVAGGILVAHRPRGALMERGKRQRGNTVRVRRQGLRGMIVVRLPGEGGTRSLSSKAGARMSRSLIRVERKSWVPWQWALYRFTGRKSVWNGSVCIVHLLEA